MQNYVSKELTHFVGRSQPDNDARYSLLLRIFRGGLLRDGEYASRQASPIFWFDVETEHGVERENFHPQPKFEVRPHGAVDANEFVAPEMVCFCDIPLEQLEVHTEKYSKFGLAFSKSFLLARGANPVWYVAKNAATQMDLLSDGPYADFFAGELSSSSRGEFLERMKKRLFELDERESARIQHALANYRRGIDDPMLLREWLFSHLDFLMGFFAYFFGYIKTFDPELTEEHPDNYYMEREWRVIGTVRFEPTDVVRILLPSAFVERFRHDVPTFSGEITEL